MVRVWIRPLVTLLMLALALPGWAGLTARIDRAQLQQGESFQLVIKKSGRYNGTGPDLTPLERDFEVLGSSRNSQINYTNGELNAFTQWSISLAPKRAGTLNLPAIELDGERTPSFPVQVGVAATPPKGSQGAAKGGEELFLELEVGPERPYLQAQITYKLRILRTIDLHEASLIDPEVEGALVERLGDDLTYTADRDGRRYQVIERRYAIFPQRSGLLKIVGPVLNAEIPDRGRWRDSFSGIFTRTRPVQIKAPNRTLEVRPAQGDGPWLPAQGVTLREEWSPEGAQWRVGDPVTRILTLEARGLTGAHLPTLHVDPEGEVSGYPDQPAIETGLDGDRLSGRRVERIALVPNRPGPFTLPEIRVRWWDTEAERARVATLAARTIQVAVAEGAAMPPPVVQPLPTPEQPVVQPTAPPVFAGDDPRWRWLSAVFAALWLATMLLWWWRSRREPEVVERPEAVKPGVAEGEARKWLQRACTRGDRRQARAAALAWGEARWPERPPFSLGELARRVADDADAARALRELDRSLYHPEEGEWDGAACWARVKGMFGKVSPAKDGAEIIPPLYS